MSDRPWGFVAVHAGAGRHARSSDPVYKQGMAEACKAAAQVLQRQPADPLEAVAAALKVLEDDAVSNAGFGSNLNFTGHVECDASVMAGDGMFGAIGAAPGIKNPGLAAGRLAQESRNPLTAGRVRPMFLAGDGARKWALEQGLEAAASCQEAAQMHVTARAQRQHRQWMRLAHPSVPQPSSTTTRIADHIVSEALDPHSPSGSVPKSCPASLGASRQDQHKLSAWHPKVPSENLQLCSNSDSHARNELSEPDCEEAGHHFRDFPPLPASCAQQLKLSADPFPADDRILQHRHVPAAASEGLEERLWDTVGAVCCNASGMLASGVSSGGIALKTPGRVGEAAMYACGCWAQDPHHTRSGAACSTSGVGEVIMRGQLAKNCCHRLLHGAADLEAACAASLAATCQQAQEGPHDCGVLMLKTQKAGIPSPSADAIGLAHLEAELVAAVRAPSMAFCYWHGAMQIPRAIILRNACGAQDQPAHFGIHTSWPA
ncbi:hypothetical protein WJX74_001192 [Apatococcus lobatus]|uniref:Threonine aspartase n=1 Tax=Apatococcus lobatus TaxID=904363 RepID=A0AAW1RTY8_9CHLO